MDAFTKGYILAMFFTESGEENLKDTGLPDISEELMKKIKKDCAEFQEKSEGLLSVEFCNYTGCSPKEYAGHDFWLERNGHGCGFGDGYWFKSVAEELIRITKSFKQMEVCLGDDGKIYA